MKSNDAPKAVIDAVRELRAAILDGPSEDKCEREDLHDHGCKYVHAGLVEHWAEQRVIREVRKCARS